MKLYIQNIQKVSIFAPLQSGIETYEFTLARPSVRPF